MAGGLAVLAAPAAASGAGPTGRAVANQQAGVDRSVPVRGLPHATTIISKGAGTTRAVARAQLADLTITKAGPERVLAGEEVTYTISVTNNGAPAERVGVRDVLPAGVEFLASSIPCQNNQGTLTCGLGPMANNQTIQLVIQVRVPAGFTGVALTNTATVTSPQDETDSSATVTTTVATAADLSVTKLCKPDEPAPADTEGYCDIYVDNLGPSDAQNVSLTDVLTSADPFQVSRVRVSPGTCSALPTGPVRDFTLNCTLGTIPAGTRGVVRVVVTAADVAQINDVATVRSTTADPEKGNNQATGRVDFVGSADLSLTKTGDATADAGTNLEYTITVTNNGPSTARDVVVRDTMPAGVSFVSVSMEPPVGSCTNGQPNGGRLECGLGNLAGGASVEITVIGRVAVDLVPGTILFNEAIVSSATADPDNSDVRASVPTEVTASADLSVTKSGSPDPVTAGNELKYRVVVTNAGPSDAQAVVLTDTLPAGTTFVSSTGAVCAADEPGEVVCALGTFAQGEREIVLTVAVGADVPDGRLTNTVTVSSPTPDPNTENNTFTTTTAVETYADLAIEAAATQTWQQEAAALSDKKDKDKDKGTVVLLTLTVRNLGPSDAQDVTVLDQLPLRPDKVGVESLPSACTYDSGQDHVITCTADSLAAGGTLVFPIKLKVRAEGELVNTATVSSTTPDPNPENNTSTIRFFVWKKN